MRVSGKVIDLAFLKHLCELESKPSIVESICNWNAARYPQEFSKELTLQLLVEETTEIGDSVIDNDFIGVLDGHADVFYVAIGALWKSGLQPLDILNLLDSVQTDTMHLPPLPVAVQWLELEFNTGDNAPWLIAAIALSALSQLEVALGDEDAALDVIRVVCASNNTKEVKQTAPSVKANIAKGKGYVAPTEMIKSIVNTLKDKKL